MAKMFKGRRLSKIMKSSSAGRKANTGTGKTVTGRKMRVTSGSGMASKIGSYGGSGSGHSSGVRRVASGQGPTSNRGIGKVVSGMAKSSSRGYGKPGIGQLVRGLNKRAASRQRKSSSPVGGKLIGGLGRRRKLTRRTSTRMK